MINVLYGAVFNRLCGQEARFFRIIKKKLILFGLPGVIIIVAGKTEKFCQFRKEKLCSVQEV